MIKQETRALLAIAVVALAGASGVLVAQIGPPPPVDPKEQTEDVAREQEEEYNKAKEAARETEVFGWSEDIQETSEALAELAREGNAPAEEYCREAEGVGS